MLSWVNGRNREIIWEYLGRKLFARFDSFISFWAVILQ
jgi:hypothetical protein